MSTVTAGPGRPDLPRPVDPGLRPSERAFHGAVRGIGALVLLICGAIGIFLLAQLIPTLKAYGWHFFTQVQWLPNLKEVGVAAALTGTFEVAAVAMVVSVPLALLMALYITEYASRLVKPWLVSMIDLMAAVPSIIYGLWGWYVFEPQAADVTRWLSTYLGWFPLFHVDADTHSATLSTEMGPRYFGSVAIAGLVVAMMVTPIACSIMRGVFDLTPVGEREAALALGATRWGVIQSVVLPFGRGGIIGGVMLGLGRALGETIAVLIIISTSFHINFNVLQTGTITISSLIAARWTESTPGQLSALIGAGFVLFFITMIVNFLAAAVITRSRSGSATEI
jgi:phosphate transport system permease protein